MTGQQGNPFYVAPMLARGVSDIGGNFLQGMKIGEYQRQRAAQQAQAEREAAFQAAYSQNQDPIARLELLRQNPDMIEKYKPMMEFFDGQSEKLAFQSNKGIAEAASLDDAVAIQQQKLRSLKAMGVPDTTSTERDLQRMINGEWTLEQAQANAKSDLIGTDQGAEYLQRVEKSGELAGSHDLIQLTNALGRIRAQNPNSPLIPTYEQAIESSIAKTGNTSAGWQEFSNLVSGLSPEEQEAAKRIKLGLTPRAVGKADHVVDVGGVPHMVRYDGDGNPSMSPIVLSDGQAVTPESVAQSRGTVASGKKAGELAQTQSAELATQARTVQSSLPMYDEAIAAIDAGAQSGPLINRFAPTVKAETLKLENLKSELGLKLIAGANFGQLNASELELALSTVIPNLPEGELRQWLQAKKNAQAKMASQLEDAAIFLGTPGNTPAMYMQTLKDGRGGGAGGRGTANPSAQLDALDSPRPAQGDDIADLVSQYAD